MIKKLLVITAICALATNVFSQTGKDLSDLKDEQLIAGLFLTDRMEATESGKEIFRRGEKMLPLLMKLKNNKTLNYAYCLGDPEAAMGTLGPVDDATPEQIEKDIKEGYFVTMEVASLYLISAIYYNNLAFAQVAYLTDRKYVKRQQYNTPKRIAKAWTSTEKWYRELDKKGLQQLRKEKSSPLNTKKIRFYGTNPSQIRDLERCPVT